MRTIETNEKAKRETKTTTTVAKNHTIEETCSELNGRQTAKEAKA